MDKELKKFIGSLGAFFMLAIAVYCGLIIFYGELIPKKYSKNLTYPIGNGGHIFSRLQEVKKRKNVDLLFLGSSHTYRGFDTRIFEAKGYSCFNLGSSSQTPLQTTVLLKRYIEQLHPKLVVYEVYPICFTLDGVESSLDILSNDKNDPYSLLLAQKQNHIKVYNTLIFAFYADFFGRNSTFSEPIQLNNDTYVRGGFVQKKLAYYTNETHAPSKWVFLPYQLKAFDENLAILKENNIPYILVQAPITKRLYQSFKNNAQFDDMMRKRGRYTNFNQLMNLDDSLDFYDDDHLNQQGVVKFNTLFISELLKKK